MDVAYFEGQYTPIEDAKISIRTHGFLYGTSVFEGIRAYWLPDKKTMSIFRMREHYERMVTNSDIFYLNPGHSVDELCEITVELIKRNEPDSDMYIRPTFYKADENVTPLLDQAHASCAIWMRPFGAYLDLSKGLSVCVSNWRRIQDNAIPARAKAGGAYMNTALAVTDARRMGFDDAIFLTEGGTVYEGSAMNLFIVKNGKLITPSKQEDILEGITRDTLITLAKNELGLDTEERSIDRTELYHANEAFFCGTGAQVAPITQIDKRSVGDGNPGPLTRQLQELYFKVVKAELPQYTDWCTLVPVGTPAKA